MADVLTLYQLAPSPNNLKIRIALGYKGLGYEKIDIDPMDRSQVVEVSTQPLTPVLKHGERVVFDSGAILRYLDGNFPETPRLFSSDYAKIKEIEKWELYGRTDLTDPVRIVFGQLIGQTEDQELLAQANKILQEKTEIIEAQLEDQPFLTGEELNAADVITASLISLACPSKDKISQSKALAFFAKHLSLSENRDKTRAWVARVVSYEA